jgi:hypothetical protein
MAAGLAIAAMIGAPRPGHAAGLDSDGGWDIRWDNTLRGTLGFRTDPENSALLANVNGDDGDRNFAPGIESERLDLLSEFDAAQGGFGADLSADAWVDPVYFNSTANRSPATFNPLSVPHTAFPAAVRTLQGGDADLLNANVHDSFMLAGLPATMRVGRQSLLWGESLFSTSNGIAAGQAPVDEIKAEAEPLAEAKELFLPVAQASLDVALRPGLHLQMYTQLEWRRDRQPGVGSYFSTTDFEDIGGERLFTGPPGAPTATYLLRGTDRTPPGLGQGGAALTVSTGPVDLGVYALRFDAKAPEVVTGAADTPQAGRYALAFGHGIALYGASFSTYLGDSNLAGEISLRDHMPLVSAVAASGARTGAEYAIGRTIHAQVSVVSTLRPGRWWQGATLMAELSANDRLAIEQGAASLAPDRGRFAASATVLFTPQYFQVLPQLDVTVPVGGTWNAAGNSSVLPGQVARSGSVNLGIDATWRAVWQLALTCTRFLGSPSGQTLADRSFVTLSVSRTF